MKKINIRNSLIVILAITIVLLSVGFIALSIKYNNLKTRDNTFNVDFIKVKKITASKGSNKEPKATLEITKNSKEIEMSFDLYSPKDELTYEITIRNTGTNDIEIVDILMSPDFIKNNKQQISPVEITLTDISGKILEPNEETTIKLKVLYKNTQSKDEEAKEEKKEKKITGKLGIISVGH